MARGRPGPAAQTARRKRFAAVGRAGSLDALERDISAPNLSEDQRVAIVDLHRRDQAARGRGCGGSRPGWAGARRRSAGNRAATGTRVSGQYRPFTAQRLAVSRRGRPGRDKLMRDPVLRQFAADRMGERWRLPRNPDRAARDILNDDGCLAGTYPARPRRLDRPRSPLRRCRTTFSWEPRSVIRACR